MYYYGGAGPLLGSGNVAKNKLQIFWPARGALGITWHYWASHENRMVE